MGIAGFIVLCLPSVSTFLISMFLIYPLLALHTVYIRVCCVVPGLLGHGVQKDMRPKKVPRGAQAVVGLTKGTLEVTAMDSLRVICCRQAFGK